MSSSRTSGITKKNFIKGTPSPTFITVLSSRVSRVYKWIVSCLERMSLLTSGNKRKTMEGSMTVEAAVLLPLVIFFFLHLMGVVEMLRLHGKLTLALWECGNQLTVYAAVPGEVETVLPDVAVSYLYVGQQVQHFLGVQYLENSPIVQGKAGLNYLSSEYEQECIDIGVTYQVKPPVTLFPFPYMRMVNRYYARAWTGYNPEEALHYVYVTLYGEVWHSKADCTHIYIVVQETDRDSIHSLRNEDGARYYACELCKEADMGEMVYYTEQGERYHRNKECSALTRYVSAVVWKESLPYEACSRCVGGEKE